MRRRDVLKLAAAVPALAGAGPAARGDSLRLLTEGWPNTFDPIGLGANRYAIGLHWNSYDRLLRFATVRKADGTLAEDPTKLEGELAEGWEVSADGREITLRLREGRALIAMRDHELAATSAGIEVRLLRLKAFGLSSSIAAVGGCLYAYYMTNVNAEYFNLNFAIQFIAMIIIGGMGSLGGALVGAAVWLLLPSVITGLIGEAGASGLAWAQVVGAHKPQLVNLTFGVMVVVLLLFAPGGVAGLGRGLWQKAMAARARR